MARLARVVLPGHPHHITQRGNRRQDVFVTDSDYEHYLELLVEWCAHEGIKIWAYCLMTNHVHLIVKPEKKSNLAKAIDEVHRRYTPGDQFTRGKGRASFAKRFEKEKLGTKNEGHNN